MLRFAPAGGHHQVVEIVLRGLGHVSILLRAGLEFLELFPKQLSFFAVSRRRTAATRNERANQLSEDLIKTWSND